MAQQLFIIFCALLSVISANNPQPRDLVEEVYQQIFELQNIAYGEIFVGRDKLQHLEREFRDDAQKVALKANTNIQQEHEVINTQITTIIDLAHSAGKDISSCTNNREDLSILPINRNEQIGTCIGEINLSTASAVSNSRYLIDIIVNKAHHFEYQVNQCQESIECISPILTQILEEKVKIPLLVREEVQNCQDIVSLLELSVQNCADENVAEYITEANGILSVITDCAEGIMS